MKNIISKISKIVTPSKKMEDSKKEISEIAFSLVKKEIEKFSEIDGIEFGGSFAKNTWLSKDADIDIFIKFKVSTSEKNFERISKKIGFEALKKYSPYARYSEHPYVEAKIKDTRINVVPFYDVEIGGWKSAADRSPFHTKLMKKSLTSEMRTEVRILKLFLKSNGIYGAEIAKQGFSGYVSEVLIHHFETFENLVNFVAKIKENQIIGKTNKKFDTPITIVDPIDNARNLAAAISNKNLGKFIISTKAFRDKPSLEFFKNKKLKISKKHWNNLLVVKFNFKQRSPDIIWGQIKRAASSLSTQLELGGFKVLRNKSFTDQKKEIYLFFLLESITIPETYSKIGPEFFRQKDSESFIFKNLNKTELMWIENNKKIISIEKRKHTNAAKFMKEFLKNNLKTGMPKGLQNDVKKGYKISVGNTNLSKSIKETANELVSTDESILYFR